MFTGANVISKADLLRLFRSNLTRSTRSGFFRPDHRFPLTPLIHFILSFSPPPSLVLFLLDCNSHQSHPSALPRLFFLLIVSPSSLSSLLRNVHQLFLSFHISFPFIFFVCKPGIPDRRECSRLCNEE